MTIAGVLVLLVNDHLLKQSWPGLVTGKLSDVAGLVVAPALLALLFWRRADLAATVLTGVLFTAVKTTETGAELASQAWTLVAGPSRVLADPTDLLALPALALAWWVRRRTLDHPASARWRIIVTMPLAVLAVAATSGPIPPPSATAVEVSPAGRITVHTDTMTDWVSEDGGRAWTERTGEGTERPPHSAQCVPWQPTRCYRLVEGRMAVEQSDDTGVTWRTSWEPSEGDLKRLSRQYRPDGLRSRALAVREQPGGQHVVVVADGMAGITVRDPSGTWRQIGWPGAEAAVVGVEPERNVAIFLAACMLFAGAGAGMRQFTLAYTGSALAACSGLLLLVSSEVLPPYSEYALGVPVVLIGAALLLAGVTVCLVLAVAGKARPASAAIGTLAAPLVYGAVYLPFTGWARGTPDSYPLALAIAVLLTGLVVLAGTAAIRRDARRATSSYFAGSSTSRPT
ncbi:hypothetical protein ACU635_03525 [[Actinomadura] parvosata]|uniref:hypothetical protein n=1 Tax=[Actinomadura] parvosata TaxID=1955412 RepID=UPI00406CCBFF